MLSPNRPIRGPERLLQYNDVKVKMQQEKTRLMEAGLSLLWFPNGTNYEGMCCAFLYTARVSYFSGISL